MARAKAEAPLFIENICAAAKNQGGFSGQYEDLVEHAQVFINEMIYQLLDGFSVQLEGFSPSCTPRSAAYHGGNDHIGAEKLLVVFFGAVLAAAYFQTRLAGPGRGRRKY